MSDACSIQVFKKFGGRIRQSTLDGIAEEIKKRPFYDPSMLEQELTDMAKKHVHAAYKKKQAAIKRAATQSSMFRYVVRSFDSDPVKGIMAYHGGVQDYKAGSRRSVAAHQLALNNGYLSLIERRLKEQGVFEQFGSGKIDRDVAHEIADLGLEKPTGKATQNQDAKKIAKVIYEIQDKLRRRANAAGADIGKLEGYFMSQTHDMWRIRKVTRDEWVDFTLSRLDRERTFGHPNLDKLSIQERARVDKEARTILESLYADFHSGSHLKYDSDPGASGARGRGVNIGGSLSSERFLHFKSVDDSLEYNSKFGRGNMRENMVHTVGRLAKKTALMEMATDNPQDAAKKLIARLRDRYKKPDLYDQKKIDDLSVAEKKVMNLVVVLDGSASIPANHMIANWTNTVKFIQSTSKLGGALVSALSDAAIAPAELRYQGMGFLEGYKHSTIGGFNDIPKAQRRELASMLNVYVDSAIHAMTEQFPGDADFAARGGFTGAATRATNTFFKMSGLAGWTDRMRVNVALAMSARIGEVGDIPYAKLDKDLSRTLGLFDIGEKEWGLVAKAVREVEGHKFSTPEDILELPDDVVRKAFPGMEPDDVRMEVADKLRAYYIDRTEHAVLVPDARTTALMRQGTQAGTVPRTFFELIMQFKAYPITMYQKVWGRALYGKEEFGAAGVFEMAHLIASTTAMGYVSMTMKDFLKGREPRDPNAASTWAAAMLQGGAWGIYGDFVFGNSSRFGTSLVETLAGPTASTASQAWDVISSSRAALLGDDSADPGAKALRFIQGNTPFANVFYYKWAIDYALTYRIQEWMNPGYLRRMERRVEEENKQEFMDFARPSNVIPYGGF